MPKVVITAQNHQLFFGPTCPWPHGRELHKYPGAEGPRPQPPTVAAVAEASDALPIYNAKQRTEIIRAQRGTFLHDLNAAELPAKDQGRTNFCWANAVVRALEHLRGWQGQPLLSLSAAAVACKITHFRNQGGYPEDALDYVAQHGAPSTVYWPNAQIDKRYDVSATWKDAKQHALLRLARCRGWDEQQSALIARKPLVCVHAWWGHAVAHVQPELDDDGNELAGFDNSWGSTFGDDGYALLDKDRGTADGNAWALLSETFSTD
jgi:hypothetical protein